MPVSNTGIPIEKYLQTLLMPEFKFNNAKDLLESILEIEAWLNPEVAKAVHEWRIGENDQEVIDKLLPYYKQIKQTADFYNSHE